MAAEPASRKDGRDDDGDACPHPRFESAKGCEIGSEMGLGMVDLPSIYHHPTHVHTSLVYDIEKE